MIVEGIGNGHADDGSELELDRLVAEEVAALTEAEPLDDELDRLAARLRAHPEREALLDQLRRLVLGEPAIAAPQQGSQD